jgi:outer membrane protein assembly factor BamB
LVTATSEEASPELRVGLYGDITTAKDQEIVHTWWLYAYDRGSGKEAWKARIHQGAPATKRHIKATHANSTPATDGEHIVVFLGSEGLHCFDKSGKRLWRKDFGTLDAGYYMIPAAQWGFASSPVIHGNRVIALADVQKNGFIASFDLATGREVWKVKREDVPSWTTPTVVGTGAQAQVVVNGFKHTGGYDLATGAERWRMAKYGGDVAVPRPVAGDGVFYLTNGHGRSPVFAVRNDARGDITLPETDSSNEGVAWTSPKGGAYMQTPILLDGRLYVCNDNGNLTVFDAASGDEVYKARLTKTGEGFTASGVAAGGHLYYASENGDVHIVKAGLTFELVGVQPLGEITMATPAIAEGTIYFRTRRHLIAIGAPRAQATAAAGE